MANQPRVPTSQRFAYMSPSAATQANPPGYPDPGLNQQERHDPVPMLTFPPIASLFQQGGDQSAVSAPPALAGPVATMPTMPMQDYGQVMGHTADIQQMPDYQEVSDPD